MARASLLTALMIITSAAWANPAPNILFIISDDHGWGDLPSNWDKTEVQMPRLDALAKGGTRFTKYHTVPLCAPSRACLFTGQFTSENGMWRGPGGVPGEHGYRGIKRDVKMLSEYLSDAGYATGGFGKWHMGAQPGEFPNDRGFDEYRGFMGGSSAYWITKQKSKMLHNGKPDDAEGHTTELFTEWSADFIRENAAKNKPFFCYVSYNAVHGPIRTDKAKPASAPKAWVDKALDRGVSFLRSDYVAVLEHMDHNIGTLVDLLDELKVRDNTLIVFVSDNGACQMEEGPGGRFPGNNGAFRGCKASTYQGGISVPFLMNWQGQVPKGTVSDGQVMHADVFATLLDAAGIPLPKMNGKNPMRGMSLIPHMKSSGKAAIPERTMIFELWGNVGLRKGKYKLWGDVGREFSPDWPALVAKLKESDLELFDLSKDVGEQNDLRTQLPEVYATLKKELIDHFTNVNAEYPSAKTHPELFEPYKNAPAPAPKKRRKKKATPKAEDAEPAAAVGKGGMTNGSCFVSSSRSDERIVPDEVISSLTLRVGLQQSHSYPLRCEVFSAMNDMNTILAAMLGPALQCLCTLDASAEDSPAFKSELFKTGTLVYSDDFDGEINRERWGAPTKDKQIAEGKLIVSQKYESKEEAMKALKRDHHLGLEPVVHLNRIPEKFVCHLRYKCEKKELSPGRPILQIGHHMIAFSYLEGGGHRIKLPNGPSFAEPESKMKLGDWINLVIEYRKGEITIGVNGYSKTYKHEAVTIINKKDKLGPRFTFKGGPNCRIVFDSVRLWKCEE